MKLNTEELNVLLEKFASIDHLHDRLTEMADEIAKLRKIMNDTELMLQENIKVIISKLTNDKDN